MKENKLDLHIHSTYSDGSLSIEQLAHKAALNGIYGIAITDHDTNESWKEIDAVSFEISVIKGVEISSTHKKDVVHVLGYYLNDNGDYSKLTEKLIEIQEQRKERVKGIISKLEAFDIFIKYEDVMKYADGAVARPHIAKAILDKYKDREYTFENLFDKFLGNDKPAYVEVEEFSTEDAINLLHENHCIAVLAHPWSIKKFDFRELFLLGIDGMECDMRNLVENPQQYLNFAKEKKLIITAGSDFHGPELPIEIGANFIEKEMAEYFLFQVNYFEDKKTIKRL